MKTLRRSERKAAHFIIQHPDKIAILPLRKLAAECNVSEATILRLCRGLGFSGYQDFKMSLVPELLSKGKGIWQDITSFDEEGKWIMQLSNSLTKSLGNSLRGIETKNLKKTASLIRKAKRIIVVGLGGSAGVAYIFTDSLTGMGFLSFAANDPSYLQILPESLKKGDLLIGISHSGETDEIILLMSRAKTIGVATVAITNYEQSLLTQAAMISILTCVPESMIGSYSCEPRIAELAIIEALLHNVSRQEKLDVV